MNKLILLANLLLLLNFNALADPAPLNRAEYCERSQSPSIPRRLLEDYRNLMSFRNRGGLFNGGVCWWHSIFTRNVALYGIFSPKSRPLRGKALRSLVKRLAYPKGPVLIPGFKDLYSFSAFARYEIQKRLERMQRFDGFIKQHWIIGLWGRAKSTSPEKLYRTIREVLYRTNLKDEIVYLKLQIPGIMSHAWLVTGVERVNHTTYKLRIVDSNVLVPFTYTYHVGDRNFKRYGGFVPHIEKTSIYRSYKKYLKKSCWRY